MCVFNKISPGLHSELWGQQGEHHATAGGSWEGWREQQPSEQNTRWEEMGGAGGGDRARNPSVLGEWLRGRDPTSNLQAHPFTCLCTSKGVLSHWQFLAVPVVTTEVTPASSPLSLWHAVTCSQEAFFFRSIKQTIVKGQPVQAGWTAGAPAAWDSRTVPLQPLPILEMSAAAFPRSRGLMGSSFCF